MKQKQVRKFAAALVLSISLYQVISAQPVNSDLHR